MRRAGGVRRVHRDFELVRRPVQLTRGGQRATSRRRGTPTQMLLDLPAARLAEVPADQSKLIIAHGFSVYLKADER